MTNRRKTTLRSIMLMAWDNRRANASRAFADCLRAAWAFSKRMAKACAKILRCAKAGMHVALSPDITRSPIRRSLIGQRYAGFKAHSGAYATAVFGR